MAYAQAASGTSYTGANYTNLNGGVWSPTIFSKKVQKAFRKSSTIEGILNTDYWGEISSFGDTIKVIKEPDISITKYERGTKVTEQDIVDSEFSMIIDQSQYFAFGLDDLEANLSHVNWLDLASDRAGYKLRDAIDREVMGYMSGYARNTGDTAWVVNATTNGTKANTAAGSDELLAGNKLNTTSFGGTLGSGTTGAAVSATTSIPVAADGGAGAITSPLAIMNRIMRKMDEANVDSDGRWMIIDPAFKEVLMDSSSKLINSDFGGGDELRNGLMPQKIRGMRIYVSNNLPLFGTGGGTTAAAGSREHFSILLAGHDSCGAMAQQISKVETFRSPESFRDIVRGLSLYGRKILRPESVYTAQYNLA
jgi:hypothetical protein